MRFIEIGGTLFIWAFLLGAALPTLAIASRPPEDDLWKAGKATLEQAGMKVVKDDSKPKNDRVKVAELDENKIYHVLMPDGRTAVGTVDTLMRQFDLIKADMCRKGKWAQCP